MTCLRQAFDKWVNSEPDEIEERPTEEQIAEFEESEKIHTKMFDTIEHLALNLSRCLGGVGGKIKDQRLADSLTTFVQEGIRYAFEGNQRQDDDLVLGSRLPFLRLLSRYSTNFKQDKGRLKIIRETLDSKIKDLRLNEEFDEVHEDDLKCIDIYRESLGMKKIQLFPLQDVDEGESQTAATPSPSSSRRSSRGRLSTASKRSRASTQNSLSPLMEEDATMGSSEDGEPEESPSPKRRRTTSSSRRSKGESVGSTVTKTSTVRTIDEEAEDDDSSQESD